MMSVFPKAINPENLKQLQVIQYDNVIFVQAIVPALAAGGALTAELQISNIGDFLIQRLTCDFTTLISNGAGGNYDDGVDHLKIQLKDNSGTNVWDSQIPCHLWSMPGRVRFYNPGAPVTDPAGNVPVASDPLLYPGFPFHYIARATNTLQLEARNDSDVSNTFRFAAWGIRLKGGAVQGAGELREAMSN
jgi:hypothetical protein